MHHGWITRLPFPVHCVENVTMTDKWRQTSFSTQYTYHHGYYDNEEREFRGFGRVEQIDVETYGAFAGKNRSSPYISDDQTLYQPPVKTITWFHTGAFLDHERILTQFEKEYFPGSLEHRLPEPDLSQPDLSDEELPEALRACKRLALRSEVYELAVDALETGRNDPLKLLTASMKNCQIHRVQPRIDNRHAVFLLTESETLTCHYELSLEGESSITSDPRIHHTTDEQIKALEKSELIIQERFKYYSKIKKINPNEQLHLDKLDKAQTYQESAQFIQLAASLIALIPDIDLGASGFGGTPTTKFKFGGINLAQAAKAASGVLSFKSMRRANEAAMAAIKGVHDRRWQEWKHQEQIAQKELDQIKKQIDAADIRKEIAQNLCQQSEAKVLIRGKIIRVPGNPEQE